MARSETGKTRLTFGEAIKDVRWFWLLFTSLVSAPSLLSLVQIVFVDHRFVDALQWIVDGYNDIAAVLGSLLEPLLHPLIAWLNELFNWQIELHGHWRPLLMVSLTFSLAFIRAVWRYDILFERVSFAVLLAIGSVIGAAIGGLAPMNGGWAAHGVIATAPVAAMYVCAIVQGVLSEMLQGKRVDGWGDMAISTAALSALAFAVGAGAWFVPGLSAGAGIAAFAALMLCLGAWFLATGLADADTFATRVGLTMTGGFFTAGVILAADAIIKLLTS